MVSWNQGEITLSVTYQLPATIHNTPDVVKNLDGGSGRDACKQMLDKGKCIFLLLAGRIDVGKK